MNVQEMIEDVNLLAPNSFSITQKVGWFNQVQRQIYRDFPTYFSSKPQDMKDDNLTFVPRIPEDFHELLVTGVAKRIFERVQDYKSASEIEGRYQGLLLQAKLKTAPIIKKVKQTWPWR